MVARRNQPATPFAFLKSTKTTAGNQAMENIPEPLHLGLTARQWRCSFKSNELFFIMLTRHTRISRSEERYRSLVAATAQLVWTTDAQGNVAEDLPTWRAFTGQTEEEIKGQGWINALHPDDRAPTAAVWAHAVQTCSSYATEYRVRRHDGE